MPTRQLGQSSLEITPIGLGAWAIGGAWRFGWGPQDDADSIAAIRRAVERGMNWIDTAPAYGLGRSESVVGEALRNIPANDRPYVFTKCSLVWDEDGTVTHSLRPASIRRECEASLMRLGVERIDLYQIHWPKWQAAPAGDDPGSIEDAWHTMSELRREGKIRYLGASNFDADQLARVHAIAPVTSLQPPYSIVRRDVENGVLPWCREHGVGVIVYSPMQSGLLSGKMTRERIASLPEDDWRRNAAWFQEPQPHDRAGRRRGSPRHRRPARSNRRRGRHRVDAAQPGGDRRDCRRATGRPGRRVHPGRGRRRSTRRTSRESMRRSLSPAGRG